MRASAFLTIERQITVEVLAPFFADIGMIKRNKVHNICEVSLVELAAVVR